MSDNFINYTNLSENAQRKLDSMLRGVESHMMAIARPYGNGHQVDTISKSLGDTLKNSDGWSEVVYDDNEFSSWF